VLILNEKWMIRKSESNFYNFYHNISILLNILTAIKLLLQLYLIDNLYHLHYTEYVNK